MTEHVDVLVVGAGFAGAVMAERLTHALDGRVLLIDRRDHIGGNAHDSRDEHGILVHRYGPHIFHTNADVVIDYLSRFTAWRPYEHRVLARLDEQLVPMPINRTTLNELYGLSLTSDEEVERFYAEHREPVAEVRTSEEAVVSKVGRDLYERFFRGYTRKQWNRDPSELDASVCARIPVRTGTEDRYFTDRFQNMPRDGYTAMFERMLEDVEVWTSTAYEDVVGHLECDHVVFTGPIDEFFACRHGELPYRSIEFVSRNVPTPDLGLVQRVGTVNEPSVDVPHTRTTEYRHLTGQRASTSTLHLEIPRAQGDPYYPIPTPETKALHRRYQALAAERPDVTFVGRLGRYQYLNMDQVVAQALTTASKLIARLTQEAVRPRAVPAP